MKNLISFAVVVLFASTTMALDLGGVYSHDMNLTLSDSPVNIVGATLIDGNVTIAPGVLLNIWSDFHVSGNLTGNKATVIGGVKFTGSHLFLIDSDFSHIQSINADSVEIENCIIRGYIDYYVDESKSCVVEIHNSLAMYSFPILFHVQDGSSANVIIQNNEIVIRSDMHNMGTLNGNLVITQNRITSKNHILWFGLPIGQSLSVDMSLNYIEMKLRFERQYSHGFFMHNDLNLKDVGVVHGSNEGDIDISQNYWETTDAAVIDGYIHDIYDDYRLNEIIYQPFSLQPFTVGIVPTPYPTPTPTPTEIPTQTATPTATPTRLATQMPYEPCDRLVVKPELLTFADGSPNPEFYIDWQYVGDKTFGWMEIPIELCDGASPVSVAFDELEAEETVADIALSRDLPQSFSETYIFWEYKPFQDKVRIRLRFSDPLGVFQEKNLVAVIYRQAQGVFFRR